MTRRQGAAAGTAALSAVALLLAWLMGEGSGERPSPAPADSPAATAPLPPATGEGPPFAPSAAPEGEGEPARPAPPPPRPRSSAPEVPEEVCVLEGAVLDLLDRPVAGAVVSWGTLPPESAERMPRFDIFREPVPAAFSREPTAVTGEEGTFRLAGPPQDRVVVTALVAGGRVEPLGPFRLEGNRSGVVLRVTPATFLSGVVLRPPPPEAIVEGEEPPPPAPEAGARVAVWNWRPGAADAMDLLGEATTDAEGRFRIEGLPPGRCTVEARGADGAGASLRLQEEWPADLRLLLEVPMGLTSVFEGVVLLSDGSTPAAWARLEVVSSAAKRGEAPLPAHCGEDGSFLLAGVPSLGPSKECPLVVTVDAGTRGVARLGVPAWPRSGAERIVLWPPAFRTVEGRAVEFEAPGSPPLPGLPLEIRSRHEDPADPRIRIEEAVLVRTRADGSFAAEGQGAHGIEFSVPAGAAPWTVERAVEEEGGFRVEVVPACILEGTVRTAEGELVEGALCSWDGRNSVLSDGQGRFRFHPVPGNRTLVVTARAPGWAQARSLPVTVPAGRAVRDLVVVLDVGLAALSGRVVDGAGGPVALARVEFSPTGKEPGAWNSLATTWTDAEGRWRVDLPPGGPWRVTATAFACRPDFVDEVAGGGTLRDLRLVRPGAGK